MNALECWKKDQLMQEKQKQRRELKRQRSVNRKGSIIRQEDGHEFKANKMWQKGWKANLDQDRWGERMHY